MRLRAHGIRTGRPLPGTVPAGLPYHGGVAGPCEPLTAARGVRMTTPDQSRTRDADVESAEAGDQPAEGATSDQVRQAGRTSQAEGER
jgi:hypothetical protein